MESEPESAVFEVAQEEPSPTAAKPSPPPRRARWKRWLGLFFISLLACLVTYGYAEYTAVRNAIIVGGGSANHDLFTLGNSSSGSNVDWSRFQKAGDGRFNILLLGIGGVNDAGQAHSGTLLTDSIQVMSVDTINKKVSLTSVPRDFYYNIPGHGPSKINAVYEYGEMAHPGQGGQAAKTAFGKVLGIDISNFVVIDFTAAKDAINTVGGIDINVPTALYDPSYPCPDEIHFCPFSISAGMHHMDGDLALKYMRTRHADNDFARSKRQQAVLATLKSKALSLGILSNPSKVTQLLDILSRHVKIDLQTDEITALLGIAKEVPEGSTSSNVLDTSASLGLLTATTEPIVGYTNYPVGGHTAYGPIHLWFQKNSPDPLIAKESAQISIAQGDTVSDKQFQSVVKNLQDYGFKVQISSAPIPGGSDQTAIYVNKVGNHPVTENYLKTLFGLTPQSGSPLQSGADIEIIYRGGIINY